MVIEYAVEVDNEDYSSGRVCKESIQAVVNYLLNRLRGQNIIPLKNTIVIKIYGQEVYNRQGFREGVAKKLQIRPPMLQQIWRD